MLTPRINNEARSVTEARALVSQDLSALCQRFVAILKLATAGIFRGNLTEMPQFYLHLMNGTGFTEDQLGADYVDVDDARTQAILGLRDVTAGEVMQGKLHLGSHIEIETNTKRMSLRFILMKRSTLLQGPLAQPDKPCPPQISRKEDFWMRNRANTGWTADDDAQLKHLIDAGRTIPEIARLIGRSQEGTRARAAKNGWYAQAPARRKGKPTKIDVSKGPQSPLQC